MGVREGSELSSAPPSQVVRRKEVTATESAKNSPPKAAPTPVFSSDVWKPCVSVFPAIKWGQSSKPLGITGPESKW